MAVDNMLTTTDRPTYHFLFKMALTAHFSNPGPFGTSIPTFSQLYKEMAILANQLINQLSSSPQMLFFISHEVNLQEVFLLVASSNTVNTGQLRSITVN